MRIHHAALLLTFATSCTTDGDVGPAHIKLPPNGGVRQPTQPAGYVPGQAFSFGPGAFVFTGATAPGDADVVAAPVIDPNDPNEPSYGTGAYNVTLAGTPYADALSSLAMTTTDGQTAYLVFGGYRLYTDANNVDRVDQVVVLVPQSDFAVNATVALDGVDRVALFGTGRADADQPEVVGAAITGTVTFTAGSLALGGTITASVHGDFGPIDWTTTPPPGQGSITPGNYTLAIDNPAYVYCDGSLAGHETDFAGVTAADLSLAGGAVAVATPTPASVTVAGAPISAAFGSSPFALDPNTPGLFAGFTQEAGPGPAGTTLAGKYFVVDASTATAAQIYAGVGAGYVTADSTGACTVAFGATLTQ